MKEAIEQFRTQFGAAIDSVEFRVSDARPLQTLLYLEKSGPPFNPQRVGQTTGDFHDPRDVGRRLHNFACHSDILDITANRHALGFGKKIQ